MKSVVTKIFEKISSLYDHLKSLINVIRYNLLKYKHCRFVVLMSDPTGIIFLEPLLKKFIDESIQFTIIVLSRNYRDVVIDAPVLFFKSSHLKYLSGRIMISQNSGINLDWVRGFKIRIHSFHSPISMTRIYPDGAFDAFNLFIASGPHHVKEARLIKLARGFRMPKIIKGGYLRIESIYNHSHLYNKPHNHFTVMLAPSWGEENIVNTIGIQLIRELLKNNWRVIFRPHPGNEINDALYIDEIRSQFIHNPMFTYDSWTGHNSLYEADILVGDWSGISFEYACALEKPVVFIDTRPKIFSSISNEITMEEAAREYVGIVVPPNDVNGVINAIGILVKDKLYYKEKIINNRNRLFYNCPSCTDVIFDQLIKL